MKREWLWRALLNKYEDYRILCYILEDIIYYIYYIYCISADWPGSQRDQNARTLTFNCNCSRASVSQLYSAKQFPLSFSFCGHYHSLHVSVGKCSILRLRLGGSQGIYPPIIKKCVCFLSSVSTTFPPIFWFYVNIFVKSFLTNNEIRL